VRRFFRFTFKENLYLKIWILLFLAEETEGLTGADIEAICREASMAAIREFIKKGQKKRAEK